MRKLVIVTCVLLASAGPLKAQDLFSAQVRPILAQHCFKCHGPDDQARKARLRLDIREEAIKPARSGKRPIVPGKPDESELMARICSSDDSEIMPPPVAKNPLNEQQKAILKRWIAAGAEYRLHWALVPPRQVPLPRVKRPEWVKNPIDAFVLTRLEKEGLQPSPRADAYTLVRRASLDLIGLPPTPEEVEGFVQDRSPDAYEKLIDRLLASPHYGERWARRWLDLARYADTNGYEKDRLRSIWPWRDWVINALNADMPFDQFTLEQIAGDLLPGANQSQRIATGFHRNTMLNEEGGIDPLEFRFYALADRVNTTGTVWLGLTLGCAQCHSHKFDPISQREYYGLFAFLNNADEPELDVVTPEITRQRQEIEAKIATLSRRAERVKDRSLESKFSEWLKRESDRSVRWTVLRPTSIKTNLPLLTVQDDDSILASGDQTKSDTYDLEFRTDLKGITAIRIEALPDDRLPKHGPGRVYYEGPIGDFTLSELTLRNNDRPAKLARASHSFAANGFGSEKAIDGNPQTGWSVNGGQGRAHWAVFNLAEPLAEAGRLQVRLLFERHFSAGLGRFRIAVTTDARPAVARAIPADLEELFLLRPDQLTTQQREKLRQQFLMSTPELSAQQKEIDQLRKQLPAYPTTLVLQERPANNPRPTFLHHRGEFLQPAERVEPGVPAVLNPLPKDAPRNRLTFARWLVSPDNPLVGRVTMNRQWAAFFGQGIVRTSHDFGFPGDFPSHPELLDFLAIELVKQGWSLKKMHRLIVTSSTYQQSSRVTPELQARDPENRLLARGPRLRLEAEMIRDQALRASGLLSPKIGGPSVFPPQPPGVTTEGTYGRLDWKVSQGPDRYRRGLYTFSKRTAPYAMFATFDGPSGEVCLARRERSNTPLQALTLLNDPALIEAAQALGKLLEARPGSTEERIDHLVRRLLCRPATAEEKKMLVQFLETQRRRFESQELDAAAVAGPGEGSPLERAVWTSLARVLLNLDEAITRG